MRVDTTTYSDETAIQGDSFQDNPPAPGYYHCIVTGAKTDRRKQNGQPLRADIIELQVLAGTVPGQESKEISHFLKLNDNGTEGDRHMRFILAAGVVPQGFQGELTPSEFGKNAMGKQCIVKVEEYTKKDNSKGFGVANFGLAVWSVGHPEVAGVPKDQEALALLHGENSPVGQQAQQQQATPPQDSTQAPFEDPFAVSDF